METLVNSILMEETTNQWHYMRVFISQPLIVNGVWKKTYIERLLLHIDQFSEKSITSAKHFTLIYSITNVRFSQGQDHINSPD